MPDHVIIRPETPADTDAIAAVVEAADRQRQGIGSALVREVAARAEAAGVPLIVLEGSPAYYGRLGFEHSVPLGIEINLPSWAPAEAAQVLRLAGYDPAIRGVVVYPPAFDAATG